MHIPISHFGSYKAKCTKRIQEKCIYVNANAFLHASESILNSSRMLCLQCLHLHLKQDEFNSLSSHLNTIQFLQHLWNSVKVVWRLSLKCARTNLGKPFCCAKKKRTPFILWFSWYKVSAKKQYAYIVNTDLLVQLTMRVKQGLNLLNTVTFVLCLSHNNYMVITM